MAIVDNNFYQDVALQLEGQLNKDNHRYFYGQRYYDILNPLRSITPLYTEFWGPKVLSMVIISRNYGWTNGEFSWPPPQFEESKELIKTVFTNWIEYRVKIWVDLVLADRVVEATPASEYRTQMLEVANKMELLCAEMSDFGFEWMGVLESGRDANYFKQFVDEFWSGR